MDEIGVQTGFSPVGMPSKRACARLRSSVFQPIWGIWSEGSLVSSRRHRRRSAEPLRHRLSSPRDDMSCMPTQNAEEGAAGFLDRLRQRFLHASTAGEAAAAVGIGADAGSTMRSAVATRSGLSVRSISAGCGLAGGALEALVAERRLPDP